MSNENDVIVANCILSGHEKVNAPREPSLIKIAQDLGWEPKLEEALCRCRVAVQPVSPRTLSMPAKPIIGGISTYQLTRDCNPALLSTLYNAHSAYVENRTNWFLKCGQNGRLDRDRVRLQFLISALDNATTSFPLFLFHSQFLFITFLPFTLNFYKAFFINQYYSNILVMN